MKEIYTINLALSKADIHFLRKLYGKNKNTGVKRLVAIAIRHAVAESAKAELAKTGYAPIEEDRNHD